MKRLRTMLAIAIVFAMGYGLAQVRTPAAGQADETGVKGWTKGKGWGPWGAGDEVGSLNGMTPGSIREALSLAKGGKVYDLGIDYDAQSYKWPGHAPAAIMTFRGPEAIRRMGDLKFAVDPVANSQKVGWHSCALFLSDNVATQIDGLGHITHGHQHQWYNGFKEADWGGDFGVRKCDATTIPPIITRGVVLDVAGFRKTDALPANYRVTAAELEDVAKAQGTQLRPGDTVLIRTGTLRYWDQNGRDHQKIGQHDSAGIDLGAAKWLVEQKGAILVGSDTSGLEYVPVGDEAKAPGSFNPVHKYLLCDQGVHIGEFHQLEDLVRDRVYEFCYIATVNRIRGATAGFALRPIALR